MGQTNLKRTQFIAREPVVTPANDDKQLLAFTGYFKAGDVVDVVDVDANGNIISTLADNLTILAIDPNISVTLSSVVDTTAATGTPMIICQEIDDGQEAVDRLYRRSAVSIGAIDFYIKQPILAQALNSPIAGQTTFQVADVSFVRPGDVFDILADEGVVQTSVTVVSVNPNADETNNQSTIVISSVVDTSTFTNPYLLSTSITADDAIRRNREDIDSIDQPIENEYMGVGNGTDCAYEAVNLFRQGSTKVLVDGIRKRLGTAGTRATLTQGAGNAQLIFTSMLLGLLGNEVRVRVVAGAGLTITVSKTFKASSSGINTGLTSYDISINDNGGAATAEDIANALNAHTQVKRLVQVQWGGDGSGVVTPFAYTSLTGGLDNGTGDYAELPQILNNVISLTGYKWISFRIVPNDKNRMNEPPQDDEEQVIDYRKILVNA